MTYSVREWRHLRVEPFCTLCHASVPIGSLGRVRKDHSRPNDVDKMESWSVDFICTFKSEISGKIHVFRVDIRQSWANDVDSIAIAEQLHLCFSSWPCSECDLEFVMNLTHTQCFQLAQARISGFAIRHLRDIFQQTRPILTWNLALSLTGAERLPRLLPSDISTSSSLGKFIEDIKTALPLEVQALIYENITGCFRSLMDCSSTLLRYSDTNSGGKGIVSCLNNATTGPIKVVGAEFIDILGENCISRIEVGHTITCQHTITLLEDPIYGIQFSLGTYGIVAFRVLYQNKLSSEWLGGGGARRWTASRLGNDLAKLLAYSNGYKLLRLEFEGSANESTPEVHEKEKAFWDNTEIWIPNGLKHLLVDVEKPPAEVLGNPGARLLRYMDFREIPIDSLTVFHVYETVSGFQINGTSGPSLYATAYKVAMTYYFYPGERIKSVRIVFCGQKREGDMNFIGLGPYVMFHTTAGRSLYYGICTIFNIPSLHICYLEDRGAEVTGLFIDPTTARGPRLHTLGVAMAYDGKANSHTNATAYQFAHRLVTSRALVSSNYSSIYLTRASLQGATSIKMQKIENRCVGLCIEYACHPNGTLGQWNPAREDTISLLFCIKRDKKALTTLTFVFSDPSEKHHVENIITSALVTDKPTFTWEDPKLELVWLFTPFYDHIEFCDGHWVASKNLEPALPTLSVS